MDSLQTKETLIKTAKACLKIVAMNIILISVAWLLYTHFGHDLIRAMYEGKSIGILNRIIAGQALFPVENYYIVADRIVMSLLGYALFSTIVFIIVSASLALGIKAMRYIFILIMLFVFYCFAILIMSGYQFFIILLPIISSYLFASFLFGKVNIIDKLNTVFLILCCQIIFITQALSLFNKINGVSYLVMTMAFFLISLFMRKGIRQCILFDFEQLKACKSRLYQYVQNNKLLTLWLTAILVSFLWRMFLIIYVPPNNFDSMTYHLSRVAYWLQHQSLRQYHTHMYCQIVYPFNAEILLLWTMVASKLDHFCGFIQFACYILSGTLVYRCVRHYLKIEAMPSLITMLIWYSLPEIILESTSTQSDLVVSYFAMFTLVYFLLGISTNTRCLVLSAIALGIAIGAKVTAGFFILPFAILILILLLKGIVRVKRVILWGSISAASFALFGSYSYIQNYVKFRNMFGSPEHVADPAIHAPSLQSFISNLSQHIFCIAANQSGLPLFSSGLFEYYNIIVAKIGSLIFRLCHIPVNIPGAFRIGFSFHRDNFILSEDTAYFGIIGMVLILLTAYIFLIGAIRLFNKNTTPNRRYLIFAFIFTGYLSALSYFMKWDPWASRYIITAVLAGIPLLALISSSKIFLVKKTGVIIILYSILVLISATFMNCNKPFTRLWEDRIGLRFMDRKDMERVFRKYYSLVPRYAKVGVLLLEQSWDYPLFGERLERTIVPINLEIIQGQKFDFLVIIDSALEQNIELKEFITKNYKKMAALGKHIYYFRHTDPAFVEWVLYVHN